MVQVTGGTVTGGANMNDVWRSIDGGAAWTRIAAAASWTGKWVFVLYLFVLSNCKR